MLNQNYRHIENEAAPPMEMGKSGPIGLIIASMVGILVWLVFILLFALYWSDGFSLFQNIIVFLVSLGIAALLIGMMWIVWGRNKMRTWSQ